MIRYQEEWKEVTRVLLPKINLEANVSRNTMKKQYFQNSEENI